MAIVYDAPSNTITVTEGTAVAPNTFQDIKDANDAGVWGVVAQTENCFTFGCHLSIGDDETETHFADTNKLVQFTAGVTTGNSQYCIRLYDYVTFTLGAVVNADDKTTGDGCTILSKDITYEYVRLVSFVSLYTHSTVNLYSCNIISLGAGASYALFRRINAGNIWNCMFHNVIWEDCHNLDVFHVHLTDYHFGSGISYCSGTFDQLWVTAGYSYIYFYSDVTSDFVNLYGRGYIGWYNIRCYSITTDKTITNGDLNIWDFNWAGTSTAKVYRKYQFDLEAMDIDGVAIEDATVKIWDTNDNLVTDTTTDGDGKIAQQTLTYGYYDEAGGNTPTLETPHKLQISKSGYETYYGLMTADKQLSFEIILKNSIKVNLLDDEPIIKLHPESYVDKERRKFIEV